MSFLTTVFVFFLVWWVLLFVVLPMRVERDASPKKGVDAGAPKDAQMKFKLKLNTVLAIVVTAIIYIVFAVFGTQIQAYYIKEAHAQAIVSTNQSVCRYIVEHRLATGMDGAEYVPGVDAAGRAVVPADIESNEIDISPILEFELSVDAARYAGLSVDESVETFIEIGTMRVINNRLYFNGEALKPESEQALIAYCKEDVKDESATGEPANAE